MNIPDFIITSETATIIVGGMPYQVTADDRRYDLIVAAIDAQDWQGVVDLTTEVERIKSSTMVTEGDLVIQHGQILWNGERLNGYLVDHILRTLRDGEDARPFINFLARLKKNPSYRMVQGLFQWVEKGKMKITPDGLIVAYKKVRADFTDAWTGTMDNSIGARPYKERNAIDDEPDTTCASSGLHFCSKDYLPQFASYGSNDHIMVIHVDPADVVSFPKNEAAKGRASTYLVVDMVPPGEDPDLYIRAGLRPGSDFVVETTTQHHPEPAQLYDDSVGASAWAKIDADDAGLLLLKLAAAEDQLGYTVPHNLPARLRAAETGLCLTPSDVDDWEARIEDISIALEGLANPDYCDECGGHDHYTPYCPYNED